MGTADTDPAAVLNRLLGLPSWLAERGHGSFLTFEFGRPELRVGEVREVTHPFSEGVAITSRLRSAYVYGDWHLWIYCCNWSISVDGQELAHSESPDITMRRAIYVL